MDFLASHVTFTVFVIRTCLTLNWKLTQRLLYMKQNTNIGLSTRDIISSDISNIPIQEVGISDML